MANLDDIWNQTMQAAPSAAPASNPPSAVSLDDIWKNTVEKSATPPPPKTFWQRQGEIPGQVLDALDPGNPHSAAEAGQGLANRLVTAAHGLGNMATFGQADKLGAYVASKINGVPYNDVRNWQSQAFGGLSQQYPASNFAGSAAGLMTVPAAALDKAGLMEGGNIASRAGKALFGASVLNGAEQAGNGNYTGSPNVAASAMGNFISGATDPRNLAAPVLSAGIDVAAKGLGAETPALSKTQEGIDQFKFQRTGSPSDANFAQDVLAGKYGDTARTRALSAMNDQYGQVQNAYGNLIGPESKTDIGSAVGNKVTGAMNEAAPVQGAGGLNYQAQDAFNKSVQLKPSDIQDIAGSLRGYLSGTNMDITAGGNSIERTLGGLEEKAGSSPVNKPYTGVRTDLGPPRPISGTQSLDPITGKVTIVGDPTTQTSVYSDSAPANYTFDPATGAKILTGNGTDLNAITRLRESIQDNAPNAAEGATHAKALDDMVYQTLAKSQGQEVADNYKFLSDNARNGYAQFKSTFEDSPSPLVRQIVGNNVTPEKIADLIANTTNPQDIDEILKFAPEGSPERALIKQAAFKDLQNKNFNPETGQFNYGGMASGIRDLLLNNASNLSKILSPEEMAQVQQMAKTSDLLAGAPPAGGKAVSGVLDKIGKVAGAPIPEFVKNFYFNQKAASAFGPDTTAPIAGGIRTVMQPALSSRTQGTVTPPNTPQWQEFFKNNPALQGNQQ